MHNDKKISKKYLKKERKNSFDNWNRFLKLLKNNQTFIMIKFTRITTNMNANKKS